MTATLDRDTSLILEFLHTSRTCKTTFYYSLIQNTSFRHFHQFRENAIRLVSSSPTRVFHKDIELLLKAMLKRIHNSTILALSLYSGVFSGIQKFIFKLFSSSVLSSYLQLSFSTTAFISLNFFSSLVSVDVANI